MTTEDIYDERYLVTSSDEEVEVEEIVEQDAADCPRPIKKRRLSPSPERELDLEEQALAEQMPMLEPHPVPMEEDVPEPDCDTEKHPEPVMTMEEEKLDTEAPPAMS